jgi:hypothetical protein
MCRVPLRELFPENAMIGANLRVSSSDTISRIVISSRIHGASFVYQSNPELFCSSASDQY